MRNLKKAFTITAAAAMAMTAFAPVSVFAEEETFKIGGIGPMTGAAATYGAAVENGIQLAVDEINAEGGINGTKIEFKMEDDEHDAEKSVNAYNICTDGAILRGVVTVTCSPFIFVEAEAANDNMFLLTPSATAIDSIAGENAFRVCFSDPAQGTKSAQYIGENKIATKVAVIYDGSDPYSSGIYESFQAEAENQGLEVVAAEAFTADSKTDFKVQLQKAKDGGAELVFLPVYYQEAALILQQAKDLDFAPKFFGCDGLDGLLSVENFDTSLAEGVMLLTPFAADAKDEKTQKFVSAYKEAFDNQIPIQFAADAYDAVYAIKLAAEDAGLTPDMEISDMCEAMKVSMTNIELEGLTGTITWDETGEPDKEPKAVIIEDGAYKAM